MPMVSLPTSTGASWVWSRRCFQQADGATEVILRGKLIGVCLFLWLLPCLFPHEPQISLIGQKQTIQGGRVIFTPSANEQTGGDRT